MACTAGGGRAVFALARACPGTRLAASADDDALVRGLARGEDGMMAALAERHLDAVLACAWRIVGTRAEAEEVAQETFVRLLRKAPDWRPDGAPLRAWLIRVATNLGIDRRRAQARLTPLAEHAEDAVVEGAMDHDLAVARAVGAAMAELPERQRTALVLVHYQGMTGREAAACIGVSEDALESLLARARRRIRGLLAPHVRDLLET